MKFGLTYFGENTKKITRYLDKFVMQRVLLPSLFGGKGKAAGQWMMDPEQFERIRDLPTRRRS